MKKRLISLLVILTMLCAFAPVAIKAETSGTCGENTTWVLDDNGALTISGTGAMTDYEYSSYVPWYSDKTKIKSVVINNGVTYIGSWAFIGCSSLTSIDIPNSVTSIGEYAFFDCSSLTSITIPNSVTSIGDDAFFNCSSLTSIDIPDSVTSIGRDAFNGCILLKSVTISNSVTDIAQETFTRCTSLEYINIPNKVTKIGICAFYFCTALKSVNIPDSVTTIEYNAFGYCNSLTSINVDTKNQYYSSQNGILFNKLGTEIICYPDGKTDTSYTIPNSVQSIGEDAFDECIYLENVSIPNNVTKIDNGAFRRCSALKNISIPRGVTMIDGYTFDDCSSLESINLPSSIIEIGEYAFDGCTALKDVYYSGGEEQWLEIDFTYGNENLVNATIHYSEKTLIKWNYIPTEYSRSLAMECAKLSAAIYPKYHYDGGQDIFYEAGKTSTIKSVLSDYGLESKSTTSLGLGENGINYIITRSRKNVNYNGSVRPVVYVICKGTTGSEWYGNMDITGKSYSSAEKNHKSFQIAATALEGKIGEYIKNNELSNALVIVTGHSRGAAVANLTAYDLTMGKVSGVDKNGVYGYTFACPSTTQNPDTSLKNIYNFSFADDFVPAFPLDAWGYGKHGETHVASADFLKINNSSFRNNINKILQMSEGRDASFAYARTKALFKYVPTKWGSISDYYNGHPLTYVSMPNAKMPENLTLYHFVHDFLAEYMATKSKKSIAGMVSTVTSHVYRPIVAYLVDGGAAEGFMNDNHQMYTYYEALKTGKFDEKEYLPSGWDYFNISLFSESEPAEYNSEQVAALKAFISNGDNAEYLGWDAEDPETWETVTWNSAGNVETISFYYTGLSGELDLSGFSDLRQFICLGNQITELKLSGCDSLDVVDCTDNLLEELDVTSLNLKALSCEYNYLDTENMTNIEALVENGVLVSYAHQNIKPEAVYSEADIAALKTILTNSEIWDLSESPSEWYGITWEKQDGIYRCVAIDLRGLGITDSIEVSGMDALISFFCSDNELGSLKISDCPALAYLSCSECNLTEFEVSGTELEFINCENNYLDADTVDAVSQLVDAENGGIAENSQLTDATLTPMNGYSSKIKAKAQYSDKMFTITITPLAEMTDADFKVIQAEYDSNNVLKGIYEVTCEQQEDGSYICSDGIDGKCRIFVWDSVDGMKPVFEPLNIKFN